MNKNSSQYEMSIFGNLLAAKNNLPESQFQAMLKSIFEDMKQTFDFAQNAELERCIRELLPLAQGGYLYRKMNGMQEEYLQEFRQQIIKARQLSNSPDKIDL